MRAREMVQLHGTNAHTLDSLSSSDLRVVVAMCSSVSKLFTLLPTNTSHASQQP